MRPSILNPLFSSISSLKGVGPGLEKALSVFLAPGGEEKASEARVVDLLFHLPSGFLDRRRRYLVRDLPDKGIVTLEVTIGRHKPPPPHNRRIPYRIECFDITGRISLVYFHSFANHLKRLLPEGESRFVSGHIDWYQGEPQIVHPDHVLSAEDFSRMPLLEPVYPLTQGLSLKILGKTVRAAVERLPELPEWHAGDKFKARRWPSFSSALRSIHKPSDVEEATVDAPARQRLAFDELLANQLALLLVRRHMTRARGRSLRAPGEVRKKIVAKLPFRLTASQKQAAAAILRDMAAPERMVRLLQGDVGSGKTVVALLALVTAVEAGAQAAIMAPTELLARQHFATLSTMTAENGIRIEILTGREKGGERQKIQRRIKAGDCDIVIGTHALFQEGVEFRDLALTVIDEQHRFGVHQRLALQQKAGLATDMLVMTATPIPRTLSLTL